MIVFIQIELRRRKKKIINFTTTSKKEKNLHVDHRFGCKNFQTVASALDWYISFAFVKIAGHDYTYLSFYL